MQIVTWLPRTQLPFAPKMEDVVLIQDNPQIIEAKAKPEIEKEPESTIKHSHSESATIDQKVALPKIQNKTPTTIDKAQPKLIESNIESPPHFALQLMQAGKCLLLVELPTGEAFQLRDPTYQLLCSILRASKLPDTPEWLGDTIHWPLFKQATIAQGAKQAQEFLQSFISTHQQQRPDCTYLWLIGLSSIRFTTGLDEQHYNQMQVIAPLGNVLLIPGLELLLEEPQRKAPLWSTLQQYIPSWS